MSKFHHESEMFLSLREEPMSALAKALELQNPYSFEYKKLMDVYQYVADKNELCQQFLYQLSQATIQEEKAFAQQLSAKISREEARDTRAAALARDKEIVEEQQEKEKTAKELHRGLTEKVKNIKGLDKKLYEYEELKKEVDDKISATDNKIKSKEIEWKTSQKEAAEKFVTDNFKLNPDGKFTSLKNPKITLLSGAIDIIKKAFTDGKSPAEMQKHNKELINNPERMMQVDDVRKEIYLAKKINKIVDKDVVAESNKNRKILVKRIVFENGEPVFEIDASGKKRAKTELVEEDPVSREKFAEKFADIKGSNESTKKHKRLVCLGDVCFLQRELINEPCSHAPEQTKIGTELLVLSNEKNRLEEESKSYADQINALKAEIAEEKKGVDQTYAQLTELHPNMKTAEPLIVEETNDQVFLGKQKIAVEPKLETAEPLKPDTTDDQVFLGKQKTAVEPKLETAEPLKPDTTHDQVSLEAETKEEEKTPRFHK